jgi:hypothetical protein
MRADRPGVERRRWPTRTTVLGAVAAAALSCSFLAVSTSAFAVTAETASDASEQASGGDPLTDGADRFLDAVAHERGIGRDRLHLADAVTQEFEHSGERIEYAKVLDGQTGQVYGVGFDAAGRRVQLESLQEADRQARFARGSKVARRLADQLGTAPAELRFPVAIWVNDAATGPPTRAGRSADAGATGSGPSLDERLATLAQRSGDARGRVVEAVRALPAAMREAQYAPVVFASLTRGEIEQLSVRADVDAIYGPEESTTFQDDAATSLRVHPTHYAGNLGAGGSARPVVHESDGVADSNPFLDNATHDVLYFCSVVDSTCNLGKNIGSHASEVAGVIAADAGATSTALRHRGIAPQVPTILSANSQNLNDDAKNVAAFEWAVQNNGAPINMSWGTTCFSGQTFMSRYVDWAVRNMHSTVVVSSGNKIGSCAEPTNSQVNSMGNAWSVLTVGAHDDFDTGFHDDDAMAGFSRFATPSFAGAPTLKPEVSSVGVDVVTTDAAGGDHLTPEPGVGGTSFSAPQVSGIVSLLLAQRPGQNQWPETNKSAVMASAWHDVEPGNTDRDGVGSPLAHVARETYRLDRFVNDCSATCNPLGAGDFPRVYDNAISGVSGVVRVVTSWDSQSTGGAGTDVLGADLDLHVLRQGDNAVMCTSLSNTNATESCTFTAAAGQSYRIEIRRFSSIGGWAGTFLGTAWSLQDVPNPCTAATVLSSGLGTENQPVNTVTGTSFFDTYAGWVPTQRGKERIFQLTLTTTRDVTIQESNPNFDFHVVGQSACSAEPWTLAIVGHGSSSLVLDNLPAGTYYVVVDSSGVVGTSTLTVTIAPK